MAALCGSMLLSPGFTLSPGVSRDREEEGDWESRMWLTSDPIPQPADQFLVVGAEEGIYTLNLHELHEDTLEKVRPGRQGRAGGQGSLGG